MQIEVNKLMKEQLHDSDIQHRNLTGDQERTVAQYGKELNVRRDRLALLNTQIAIIQPQINDETAQNRLILESTPMRHGCLQRTSSKQL